MTTAASGSLLTIADNEYFQVVRSTGKKLSPRLELLMYNNFLGVLTREAWEELHEEVSEVYRWGTDMAGYLCAKCRRRPLVNMYAFGPSCPAALQEEQQGCGNMPVGYLERLWGTAQDTARSVIGNARDISAAAIERAADFVENAKRRIDDIVG